MRCVQLDFENCVSIVANDVWCDPDKKTIQCKEDRIESKVVSFTGFTLDENNGDVKGFIL